MPALNIDQITLDSDIQQRSTIDAPTVADYAANIEHLPPVEVMFDGCNYWLWDGFHRYHAHKQAGLSEITCNVTTGTKRDAILASCSANAQHGLRRTTEDKERAVMRLLADPEWQAKSTEWIAQACNVSWNMANRLRSQLPSGEVGETRIGRDGRSRPVSLVTKDKQDALAQFSKPSAAPAAADSGEWIRDDRPERVDTGSAVSVAITSIDAKIRSRFIDIIQLVDERKGLLGGAGQGHRSVVDSVTTAQRTFKSWQESKSR